MKLEIDYKKKSEQFKNMRRLNNNLLNNQWVKENITIEIKKNTSRQIKMEIQLQNSQDAAKAVLKGHS